MAYWYRHETVKLNSDKQYKKTYNNKAIPLAINNIFRPYHNRHQIQK